MGTRGSHPRRLGGQFGEDSRPWVNMSTRSALRLSSPAMVQLPAFTHEDVNPKGVKAFSKVTKRWWHARSLGSKKLGEEGKLSGQGKGEKREGEE